MRILIFGATGMVGSGVLIEALDSPDVTSVVTLGRRTTGRSHPKLEEITHDDFFDYSRVRDRLTDFDACLFCLGATSAGVTEAEYRRLTRDLAVAAAEALVEVNPGMTFCFVSGAGADSSESGRVMWARVKGEAENRLLAMPFKAVHVFRPAFIQPLKGVRSRTRIYAILYAVLAPATPLLLRLFPRYVTRSTTVGRAMLEVAAHGFPRAILENWDINEAGGG